MVDMKFMEHFVVFRGNDHVIHVDMKPALSIFFLENVIHHCLESREGVGQSKEHYCWFKKPFTSLEGGLVLIAFFNTNIVVSPMNVEFREEMLFCQVIDEL